MQKCLKTSSCTRNEQFFETRNNHILGSNNDAEKGKGKEKRQGRKRQLGGILPLAAGVEKKKRANGSYTVVKPAVAIHPPYSPAYLGTPSCGRILASYPCTRGTGHAPRLPLQKSIAIAIATHESGFIFTSTPIPTPYVIFQSVITKRVLMSDPRARPSSLPPPPPKTAHETSRARRG